MIARRPRRTRRRLIHALWRDAAWSVALFIVLFVLGLWLGSTITGRYGW